jgi:hypothetical protein
MVNFAPRERGHEHDNPDNPPIYGMCHELQVDEAIHHPASRRAFSPFTIQAASAIPIAAMIVIVTIFATFTSMIFEPFMSRRPFNLYIDAAWPRHYTIWY